MARIESTVTREKRDREERQSRELKRLQEKLEVEDKEYAVPGWVRPEPAPLFLRRRVERKVSSGHKVTYVLEP
jgi:hypothetical protein